MELGKTEPVGIPEAANQVTLEVVIQIQLSVVVVALVSVISFRNNIGHNTVLT